MIMSYEGTREQVQEGILKTMEVYTTDIIAKTMECHPLIPKPTTKPAYALVAFASSVNQCGQGYLISNDKGKCKGLYVHGKINLVEAARFARMTIPEIFPQALDKDQEEIFQEFIRVSLDAIIQDFESCHYLWDLISFT